MKKYKNIDIDSEMDLENIQKSREDSVERNLKRRETKRKRFFKKVLKSYTVGKLSNHEKKFSEFRHFQKTRRKKSLTHLNNCEERVSQEFASISFPEVKTQKNKNVSQTAPQKSRQNQDKIKV